MLRVIKPCLQKSSKFTKEQISNLPIIMEENAKRLLCNAWEMETYGFDKGEENVILESGAPYLRQITLLEGCFR